jgi:hypothetical protein
MFLRTIWRFCIGTIGRKSTDSMGNSRHNPSSYMIILYPTHKWNKFSAISAIWPLASGLISLRRVLAAKHGPITIAYKCFSLPLELDSVLLDLPLKMEPKDISRDGDRSSQWYVDKVPKIPKQKYKIELDESK